MSSNLRNIEGSYFATPQLIVPSLTLPFAPPHTVPDTLSPQTRTRSNVGLTHSTQHKLCAVWSQKLWLFKALAIAIWLVRECEGPLFKFSYLKLSVVNGKQITLRFTRKKLDDRSGTKNIGQYFTSMKCFKLDKTSPLYYN